MKLSADKNVDLAFAMAIGLLVVIATCLTWGASLHNAVFNFGFGVTQAEEITAAVVISMGFGSLVAVITFIIDEKLTETLTKKAK